MLLVPYQVISYSHLGLAHRCTAPGLMENLFMPEKWSQAPQSSTCPSLGDPHAALQVITDSFTNDNQTRHPVTSSSLAAQLSWRRDNPSHHCAKAQSNI